jgi:uncharacterized protein
MLAQGDQPRKYLFMITAKGYAQQTERLINILRATSSLMQVLSIARTLDLPDWLLFSGAVYQPVLNHLTGRAADYGIKDYDLAYFDGTDLSYAAEDMVIRRVAAAFNEPLRRVVQVRNQARVHLWFDAKFGEPYTPLSSTAEALERFASRFSPSAYALNLTGGCTLRHPLVLPTCSSCACGQIRGAELPISRGLPARLPGDGPNSYWIVARTTVISQLSRLIRYASNRLSLALISPRPCTSSSVLSRPRALLKPPPFASWPALAATSSLVSASGNTCVSVSKISPSAFPSRPRQ